jgi:hypothetical protein
MSTPQLITSKQLCEVLKISDGTLLRLRKDGLPYLRVGDATRYTLDEALAWLAAQQAAKTGPIRRGGPGRPKKHAVPPTAVSATTTEASLER